MTIMLSTSLTEKIGIQYPIIQDGMGPFSTTVLAAAVSNNGGLGTVSIPGMTLGYEEAKKKMEEQIAECARNTNGIFAVNLPLGRLSTGEFLPSTEGYVNAVLDICEKNSDVASKLKVVITSAGFPGDITKRLHEAGLLNIQKVGSVHHALKAVENGVDMLIASGYEMGGHTHAKPVHTFVLGPSVIEAVSVPVIISGGVADGRSLAAALAMGAAGVAMGTRFIATKENTSWHDKYKQALVSATEGQDVVIEGVYGPARALHNNGALALDELIQSGTKTEVELAKWKDERMIAAMKDGDIENGLVIGGQVASRIKEVVSIQELLSGMAEDAANLLNRAISLVK
jgi:NAD(P)H-dependent flavin oxidoreductase YrpB (nitropropane dioxygenase family)